MLAILDYGIGNIRSVANAVHYLGMDATVTNNADEIAASDGLILPGVGAFGAGMQRIADHGLRPLIDGYAASGKPLLGICLGFQLLMRSSDELGDVAGLGYIDADIRRLKVNAKIPHIGWNTVATPNGCTEPSDLMQGLENERFYFVHSYGAQSENTAPSVATTHYGGEQIVALVQQGNIYGTQFHPEKSGEAGLELLRNFLKICKS